MGAAVARRGGASLSSSGCRAGDMGAVCLIEPLRSGRGRGHPGSAQLPSGSSGETGGSSFEAIGYKISLKLSALLQRTWSREVLALARQGLTTSGHQPPVAVTSGFLVLGGIERLVFGEQVDRENFRTRPQPVFRLFSEAATREAVPLWNQTDGQFVQLGHICQ